MGTEQDDAAVRPQVVKGGVSSIPSQPTVQARAPLGPPAGSIGRMILTWRVVLSLFLAVAAMETAASLYQSAQTRWPSSPERAIAKVQTLAGKLNSYLLGVRYHLKEIFQPDADVKPRRLGIHDRVILSIAIFILLVRLLMESKLVGDALSVAGDARWVGCKIYAFELLVTVGLAGILAWLGALSKGNLQMPLLWLFVVFMTGHGIWMVLNFIFLGGRESEGTAKFLGLGVNSLICAIVLAVGSFYATQFRDEIKIITATALVSLVCSVIGLRIVADAFMDSDRPRPALRHVAFLVVSIGLLALICVTILARR